MIRHHISFKHAWDGIYYSVTHHPNFAVHLVFATLVLIAGFFFKIYPWEWLILVFTILLVLVAEMINTSFEAMVELVSPQRQQAARIAKDTSAGMVLTTAAAAVIVGIIIFYPYFQSWLFS